MKYNTDYLYEITSEDFIQNLCELALYRKDGDGITFFEHYNLNATNSEHLGIFEINGVEYSFRMRMGDSYGFCIEFGEDYEPEERKSYRRYFIRPKHMHYPERLIKKITKCKKYKKHKKKEEDMNYDMHFCGRASTLKYYQDYAKSNGLEIITVET